MPLVQHRGEAIFGGACVTDLNLAAVQRERVARQNRMKAKREEEKKEKEREEAEGLMDIAKRDNSPIANGNRIAKVTHVDESPIAWVGAPSPARIGTYMPFLISEGQKKAGYQHHQAFHAPDHVNGNNQHRYVKSDEVGMTCKPNEVSPSKFFPMDDVPFAGAGVACAGKKVDYVTSIQARPRGRKCVGTGGNGARQGYDDIHGYDNDENDNGYSHLRPAYIRETSASPVYDDDGGYEGQQGYYNEYEWGEYIGAGRGVGGDGQGCSQVQREIELYRQPEEMARMARMKKGKGCNVTKLPPVGDAQSQSNQSGKSGKGKQQKPNNAKVSVSPPNRNQHHQHLVKQPQSARTAANKTNSRNAKPSSSPGRSAGRPAGRPKSHQSQDPRCNQVVDLDTHRRRPRSPSNECLFSNKEPFTEYGEGGFFRANGGNGANQTGNQTHLLNPYANPQSPSKIATMAVGAPSSHSPAYKQRMGHSPYSQHPSNHPSQNAHSQNAHSQHAQSQNAQSSSYQSYHTYQTHYGSHPQSSYQSYYNPYLNNPRQDGMSPSGGGHYSPSYNNNPPYPPYAPTYASQSSPYHGLTGVRADDPVLVHRARTDARSKSPERNPDKNYGQFHVRNPQSPVGSPYGHYIDIPGQQQGQQQQNPHQQHHVTIASPSPTTFYSSNFVNDSSLGGGEGVPSSNPSSKVKPGHARLLHADGHEYPITAAEKPCRVLSPEEKQSALSTIEEKRKLALEGRNDPYWTLARCDKAYQKMSADKVYVVADE